MASGVRTESIRTISADGEHYRVAAVPTTDGQALVLAQSLESQESVLKRLGAVMLLFGLAGRRRRRRRRLGAWPATGCGRCAG